jgi:hypothetical protein
LTDPLAHHFLCQGTCGIKLTVLKRTADTTFDDRSRGQVMADTLVERITGRRAGRPEPVAVNLVLSDETLLGADNSVAVIEGYGPIPAAVAGGLVHAAVTDERAKATLRRLYRHPLTGALVAMESRSRCFPRGLAVFIGLRDQTCRTPYCDAPIRHRDHAQPRNRGGPTAVHNGLGLCERCHYEKEAPRWRVHAGDKNGTHTAEFITPTGAKYNSTGSATAGGDVHRSQRNRSENRHRPRRPTRRQQNRAVCTKASTLAVALVAAVPAG